MSLRLITGGANAGAQESVREFVRSRVEQGEQALLLVPSAPDASRALVESAAVGMIGLSIHAFDGYLDELWRRHGDGRLIVGQAERLAALEVARESWRPRFLADQKASSGLVHLMAGLVQRCAESGTPSGAAAGSPMVLDLLSYAAAYELTLAGAGLIERAAAHRLTVAMIGQVSLPGTIAVDGFTGFTAPQEAFLRSAGLRSEVRVSLTHDPDTPATSVAEHVIKRIGGQVIPVCRPTLTPPEAKELVRVASALGSPVPPVVPAEGAVTLSEAWGGAAEAARIAAEVQEMRESGHEYGSIAVVFRDVAPYLHDLRSAFREAGIPIEVDATIPLAATPLGRVLGMLVRAEALKHEELMDVLRSPYSPAPNDVLDRFDVFVRRQRGRNTGLGIAASWFSDHDPDTAAFITRCRKACRSKTAENAQREWYVLVSGMLARAHTAQAIGLSMDAAAAREFMQAVAGTVKVAADASVGALGNVLASSTVALSSSGAPDHVQVMSAERARARRWACVVLAGLTEGVFPRGDSEDVLSDTAVIREFAEAGVDVAPRSGLGEERLLFYQVATRATHRLVLSRQTHDEEGRPVKASIFWEELLDLYRDPVTREFYDGEPPRRVLGLDALGLESDAPKTQRRSLRTRAIHSEEAGWSESEDSTLREVLRRSRPRSTAPSEEARRSACERVAFSASEIETYLQCPFRWCISYLVRPRELDRSIDAAAAGRLGHEIMRRFYDEYPIRTGATRVVPEELGYAREVHAQVTAECLVSAAPKGISEELACRTVGIRTWGVIEQDAGLLPGFSPMHHEWSFGMEDDSTPEEFPGFSLIGRIDRVDTDGRTLVLTDYKSGTIGSEHGAAHFVDDALIQLPLYAAVASRRLERDVSAVLYRSFKGGKPRGLLLDELRSPTFVSTDCLASEDFRAVMEASVSSARDAVDGMREGRVGADPLGGTCPAYCPARSFCDGWRPRRG